MDADQLDFIFILRLEIDAGQGPHIEALRRTLKLEWQKEHSETEKDLQRKFEGELERMQHYYDTKLVSFTQNFRVLTYLGLNFIFQPAAFSVMEGLC